MHLREVEGVIQGAEGRRPCWWRVACRVVSFRPGLTTSMVMIAGPGEARERNSKWVVRGCGWEAGARWRDAARRMHEATYPPLGTVGSVSREFDEGGGSRTRSDEEVFADIRAVGPGGCVERFHLGGL